MFLRLILYLKKCFCYWIGNIFVCEKAMVMISKAIAVCVFFLFIKLSLFGYCYMCLIIHMRVFGDGLTVDCNVQCGKGVLCLLGGVVSVGLIGEILLKVVFQLFLLLRNVMEFGCLVVSNFQFR